MKCEKCGKKMKEIEMKKLGKGTRAIYQCECGHKSHPVFTGKPN